MAGVNNKAEIIRVIQTTQQYRRPFVVCTLLLKLNSRACISENLPEFGFSLSSPCCKYQITKVMAARVGSRPPLPLWMGINNTRAREAMVAAKASEHRREFGGTRTSTRGIHPGLGFRIPQLGKKSVSSAHCSAQRCERSKERSEI